MWTELTLLLDSCGGSKVRWFGLFEWFPWSPVAHARDPRDANVLGHHRQVSKSLLEMMDIRLRAC